MDLVKEKSAYPHLKTYNYILSIQLRLRQAQANAVSYILTLIFRVLFTITLLLLIFGLAVFVFFVLHYLNLPTILHVLPVHLKYADCSRSTTTCEYPNATVPFVQGKSSGKDNPMLMAGQKYAMWLQVDLPETKVQQEDSGSGVFMIQITLRTYDGLILKSSSRSALMKYRSSVHHFLRLVVLSPLYLWGYLEERQKLHVDVIDNYQEDPYTPTIDAVIEIQKSQINIYNAELHVEARLEGLRYWMHRYPVIIGSLIVSLNFFCGIVLVGLSAYNRFGKRDSKRLELVEAASKNEDFEFLENFDPEESSEMDQNWGSLEESAASVRHRKKI